VAVENVPNAARRQRHPERDQLALDALVSPGRVSAARRRISACI
jgi:hypothetical protein